MKKIVIFIIATILLICRIPATYESIFDNIASALGYLSVASIPSLAFFALAGISIEKSPMQMNTFAAFFRITIGASCITYGLPAMLYIIYTWTMKNDGKMIRGKEFSGLSGTAMIIIAIANVIREFITDINVNIVIMLICIAIAVFAAVKSEEKRTKEI